MIGYNPIQFKSGDTIQSVYDSKVYEVIEPDKKGMAKLKNIETLGIENWNSCNNPHFKIFEGQLTLTF